MSNGLLVATAVAIISPSGVFCGSSSNSLCNCFFNNTFLMQGGVQARRFCVDKLPLNAAATAGLIRGRVPRLDGGVDKLMGIGCGGVVTPHAGSLFSSSAIVVAVVETMGVVFVKDIVTTVVVVDFTFCWEEIFFSNNARRWATVMVAAARLGDCHWDGVLFSGDFCFWRSCCNLLLLLTCDASCSLRGDLFSGVYNINICITETHIMQFLHTAHTYTHN